MDNSANVPAPRRQMRDTNQHARINDPDLLRCTVNDRFPSMRQFAKEINVSPSAIFQMCSGRMKTCTPELAQLIEKKLRVRPGSLFTVGFRRPRQNAVA